MPGRDYVEVDAFGRRLRVERADDAWVVFILGNEGKRRPARNITVPAAIGLADVPGYLDDLLHESATPERPQVRVLRSSSGQV